MLYKMDLLLLRRSLSALNSTNGLTQRHDMNSCLQSTWFAPKCIVANYVFVFPQNSFNVIRITLPRFDHYHHHHHAPLFDRARHSWSCCLSATISALHFVIPSAFYFLFTAFESLKTQGGTPVRPIQCSLARCIAVPEVPYRVPGYRVPIPRFPSPRSHNLFAPSSSMLAKPHSIALSICAFIPFS